MKILMTRIDKDRNMKRFYALELQPDMLGYWHCTRRWGRIGSKGKRLDAVFSSQTKAAQEIDKWYLEKRRRGYC